jgi:lysophospholipase L1-like esterase
MTKYNVSTIVVEGSSTAYGYYDAQYHGWANRLRMEVQSYNQANTCTPIVIDNRATPGLTVARIVGDIGDDLDRQVNRSHQLTSVLAVGINESKIMPGCTRPVMPLTAFGIGVRRCVEYSQALGARTLLVGPQPPGEDQLVSEATGSTLETDLTEEYSEVMRQVAAETGQPFVDVYGLYGEAPGLYLSDDKIHPNALGHMTLHGAISKELRVLGAM